MGGALLSYGQVDGEGAALSGAAFDGHVSAVDLGDVLDDGQSQAGAAELATAALVDDVEPFENPPEVFPGNAGPFVDAPEVNGITFDSAPTIAT